MLAAGLVALQVLRAGPASCPEPAGDVPACGGKPEIGTLCTTAAVNLHPTQSSLGMLLLPCKEAKIKSKSVADTPAPGLPVRTGAH